MIPVEKIKPGLRAYWFTAFLVIILFGRYGRDAIGWVLTKLYEFFIQRSTLIW